jgi:hypothetical protein
LFRRRRYPERPAQTRRKSYRRAVSGRRVGLHEIREHRLPRAIEVAPLIRIRQRGMVTVSRRSKPTSAESTSSHGRPSRTEDSRTCARADLDERLSRRTACWATACDRSVHLHHRYIVSSYMGYRERSPGTSLSACDFGVRSTRHAQPNPSRRPLNG